MYIFIDFTVFSGDSKPGHNDDGGPGQSGDGGPDQSCDGGPGQNGDGKPGQGGVDRDVSIMKHYGDIRRTITWKRQY